jgi:hypothetical protein
MALRLEARAKLLCGKLLQDFFCLIIIFFAKFTEDRVVTNTAVTNYMEQTPY